MTDIILWRRIDLPSTSSEDSSVAMIAAATCSARGSTIALQSLRGKGIASLSRGLHF